MSDKEDSAKAELSKIIEDARGILLQIGQIAEAAETRRKEADNSATYASQAKQNAESHAKTVSDASGIATAALVALNASKSSADELAAVINSAKGTIDAEIRTLNDRRRDTEAASDEARNSLGVVKGYVQEIELAKANALAYQKAALDAQTGAEQASSVSGAVLAQLNSLQADAKNACAAVVQSHAVVAQQAAETATVAREAKAGADSVAQLVEGLKQKDGVSRAYQEKLDKLTVSAEELRDRIEKLVSSATSAGLANAFEKQKKRFQSPQTQWFWIFIICILLLVGVSAPSFIVGAWVHQAIQWNELLTGMLMRLPVIAPLVWLAIYAGKNYMLAVRLEEDYAYKEALSMAFEGYKKEMTGTADGAPALQALCHNVIRALAEPPGRIYEGKQSAMTPAEEVNEEIDGLRNTPVAE